MLSQNFNKKILIKISIRYALELNVKINPLRPGTVSSDIARYANVLRSNVFRRFVATRLLVRRGVFAREKRVKPSVRRKEHARSIYREIPFCFEVAVLKRVRVDTSRLSNFLSLPTPWPRDTTRLVIIAIDIPVFVYAAANNFTPFRVYCLRRQRFPGCPANISLLEYNTGVRRRRRRRHQPPFETFREN